MTAGPADSSVVLLYDQLQDLADILPTTITIEDLQGLASVPSATKAQSKTLAATTMYNSIAQSLARKLVEAEGGTLPRKSMVSKE